ncbi:MAG: F0F1 ATP synthase subunit epsilon [Clostridiales bacterium]|nr:F0F1 ATP synthase subunit epsilon [Clostridiales bacterium]
MAMIHLTVVTPEGKPFEGDVKRVVARTTSGDVCILPRHIDYAAALGEGEARITISDKEVKKAIVKGGVLHVENDDVQIVTNDFEWKE